MQLVFYLFKKKKRTNQIRLLKSSFECKTFCNQGFGHFLWLIVIGFRANYRKPGGDPLFLEGGKV